MEPSIDPAPSAQADSWERFDIFAVSRLSGGRPLQAVTWHLLCRLGVMESLGLHRPSVLNFLRVRDSSDWLDLTTSQKT